MSVNYLVHEFVAVPQYVVIDNATYFIDTATGFRRDNAKLACESLKMTLISFEGDRQKWDAINFWLLGHGKF
jgi:hypothetical protein